MLLEIISDYAVNRDNKDAQAILGTWNKKIQDKINQPAIDAFIDLISGKGVTGYVVDDTVGAVNGAASGAAGGAAGGAVAGGSEADFNTQLNAAEDSYKEGDAIATGLNLTVLRPNH